MMPPTHGDPSTPYYDLPAGNMIPHIIPNSTIPLRPDSIKPLQFLAGPADETLVDALKGFLKDVDQIYGTEELIKDDGNVDIDELGQRITRDEITGDILDGETYYGWSRAFCHQMKKRDSDGNRSRSRSGSRYAHQRRYSDSSLSDRSRRSDSRSRSRARPNRRYMSRSRSRSPRRSRSRPRERSYSPRGPSPPRFPPPHHSSHPPPPPHHPSSHPYAPYGHPAGNFPPPPPPQYPGAWPPPPHLAGMPFPPAFPPSFPGPPPMPMPPGQPLPPGQFHFPPPHSGGSHGNSWGHADGRHWR